jgi:CheY-like chemotaxis protein
MPVLLRERAKLGHGGVSPAVHKPGLRAELFKRRHLDLGTSVHFVTYVALSNEARGVVLTDLVVIMVVEDDPALQVLVEEALSDGGFETAISASGEEAVTLLKGAKGKYRALVTDIHLAGKMDGWEVAKQAREIDPNFPIVYMTGAAADEWASNGVPNSILLAKPFAPAQLITAISNLLNTGPPPS